MAEIQTLDPVAEADTQSVEDFIRVGNLRDQGVEVEDAPKPAADDKATAIDEPKIDKRTREGRKQSIQQEIDALTTTKHTTQREIEEATTKLATLRAEAAAIPARRAEDPKPAPVAEKIVATEADYKRFMAMPNAPKLEAFSDYGDYQAALSLFIADARFDERMAQHQEKTAEHQRQLGWQARVQEAVKKDPTLPARMEATPASPQMLDFCAASPQGVALLIQFSNDHDLARRLSTSHPLKAAEELGKLEARLESRADAASHGPASPPVISAAKSPIKPLGGSPQVNDDVDDGELSTDEFIRRGNLNDPAITPRRR